MYHYVTNFLSIFIPLIYRGQCHSCIFVYMWKDFFRSDSKKRFPCCYSHFWKTSATPFLPLQSPKQYCPDAPCSGLTVFLAPGRRSPEGWRGTWRLGGWWATTADIFLWVSESRMFGNVIKAKGLRRSCKACVPGCPQAWRDGSRNLKFWTLKDTAHAAALVCLNGK